MLEEILSTKNDIKFPADFSLHKATISMVPFRNDIWRDNAYYAQQLIFSIVKIISQHEKVLLCCNYDNPLIQLPKFNSNVTIINIDYNDIWARDISPFFISANKTLYGLNFEFNAWGGKFEGSYFPWEKDNKFSNSLCDYLKIKNINFDVVLEGGAVATNGAGVLITTESVLLNRNRNPNLSKQDFEDIFKNFFGIQKVIWLNRGFQFDETDGHIDVFLNFIDEHNIFLAWTDDVNNPQYEIVQETFQVLSREQALDGNPFIIHKLIMPEPLLISSEEASGILQHENAIPRNAGSKLYPTYNNAYIFNKGVLVPTFGTDKDRLAIAKYKEAFPTKTIFPIYSKELLIGGGNFHCALHEIPEVSYD